MDIRKIIDPHIAAFEKEINEGRESLARGLATLKSAQEKLDKERADLEWHIEHLRGALRESSECVVELRAKVAELRAAHE